MKAFLKKALSLNVVVLIFILLGLRATFNPSGIGEALALAAVAALIGIERYIDFKRGPDINEEVKKQLDDIRSYVTSISMKQGLKKEPIEIPKNGQRWF